MAAGLASFVLEQSTAPGTGAFTLNGPIADRLTWAAMFANGQSVCYFADDGTQAEWGIGTFNAGNPNTLSRTSVIRTTANNATPLNFTGTVNVYNEAPGTLLPVLETDGSLLLQGSKARTETTFSLSRTPIGDASNISASGDTDSTMSQMGAGVYFTATTARMTADLKFRPYLDGGHYTIQSGDVVTVKGRVALWDQGKQNLIDKLDDIGDLVPNVAGKILVPYSYSILTPGTTYLLVCSCAILGTNNTAVRIGYNVASLRVSTF